MMCGTVLQAEDMSFNMNKDRRRDALTSYLLTLQQSIERERKAKEGNSVR